MLETMGLRMRDIILERIRKPVRLRPFSALLFFIIGLFLIAITGCGTLENGRRWGQDAIYPVNADKISYSLYKASADWRTWVPAAGASLSSLDDVDERVSEWATDYTPIFGSKDSASQMANYLLGALEAEVFVTALATPSGKDPKQWIKSKAKGLTVELGAEAATIATTEAFKNITNRPRPSGEGNSFPSGHSTMAFSSVALANRNLESIPMSKNLRIGIEIGNELLAAAVAWARVETNAHYLSDVLAGAALGNFIGAFMYDGFMGIPEKKPFQINIFPIHGGVAAGISFSFK
jgi:hypothetical protein